MYQYIESSTPTVIRIGSDILIRDNTYLEGQILEGTLLVTLKLDIPFTAGLFKVSGNHIKRLLVHYTLGMLLQRREQINQNIETMYL